MSLSGLSMVIETVGFLLNKKKNQLNKKKGEYDSQKKLGRERELGWLERYLENSSTNKNFLLLGHVATHLHKFYFCY